MLALTNSAAAQTPCRGDINDDDVVGPQDLALAEMVTFMEIDDLDPGTAMRADANGDGSLTVADLSAIVERQGVVCPPGPSRTPTITPSRPPTATVTVTNTPTRTPIPTPTPTQVCAVQAVTPGVVNGALTEGDCRRIFGNGARVTDAYTITAAPGQAIKVVVEATGSGGTYPPFVRVIDFNGYFDEAEGAPPIEFRTTTNLTYAIFVTSSPAQAQQTGSYRMTISSRPCTTEPLATRIRSIDGTECPDPTSPSVGDRMDFADIYTFEIAQPLSRVEITMRQLQEESDLDPVIAVYGPGGYEVFPSFQADDAAPGGFGFDAEARFVAIDPGTYTLIASGGGCNPSQPEANCGYSIAFRQPAACTAAALGEVPATSRKVVAGSLYGDTRRTMCPAPVTVPGFSELGEPEVNSSSDVYTFTALAGDVFSAEMSSDGDSQLSLFGPVQGGNPFITQNDFVENGFVSQLAATLTQDGTYTLFAVNRTPLEPPDPNDPEDLGEFVEYETFVQKCPVSGGLLPATGNAVSGRFRVTDCVGFGNYPFKSYAFDGTAGQVVTTTMSSTAVDPALTVLSTSRSATVNDDDPLLSPTVNARATRVLPTTGTYFAEMTTSRDEFEPDLVPQPAFTAAARSCAVKPLVVGTLSDSFIDNDCDLGNGRKYDVYTVTGVVGLPAVPFVLSVQPPANGCVMGLLPEGAQLLDQTCSKEALDIPIVNAGPAGFMIVADAAATRGAYGALVRTCAVPNISFGGTYAGSLLTAGCSDTDNARSDWVLFSDNAPLVRFNDGALLSLDVGFPAVATLVDAHQVVAFTQRRNISPEDLIPFGNKLGALLKIQGATLNNRGPYTFRVAPTVRQQ